MAWYSHLFQNFPQFIVIHTVKGFGIVNRAEIDDFLELSCFFDDPADVGNFGSSRFIVIIRYRIFMSPYWALNCLRLFGETTVVIFYPLCA